MSRSTFYFLSFIAAFSMAAPAVAGEARSAQSDLIPGLYLESTGHAVHIKAPAVEGLGISLIDPGSNIGQALDDEGRVDDVGGGWDGRLGFQLPGGPKGLSIEFGGSYADASTASNGAINLRDNFAFLSPVNVAGHDSFGFLGFTQTIRQRFEGDVQVWDTRVGVAMDLELADAIRSKARFGLVGGMIEQEYSITHSPVSTNGLSPFIPNGPNSFFGVIPTRHTLDEDLDNYFVGPYLGLSLEAQLTQRLSVSLETEVAFLYNEATLRASQDVVGFYFDGPGPPCSITPGTCHASESDVETSFGARPRLRVGVDLDLGPFVLGLNGGATYWSYAPQVVNAQLADPLNSSAGLGESHVSGDDMLIGDVGVKLTIPFGRREMVASSASLFGTAAGEALADLIDGVYFESAGYAVHIAAPAVEGLGTSFFDPNGNGPAGDPLDQSDAVDNWGGGWEGLLGFDLPGGMPADEDGHWSVEIGGSYARAEESGNGLQHLGNNEFVFSTPINGTTRVGILGFEEPVRQTFDGSVEIWDVRLGLAREVEIADGLSVNLRGGLVGGIFQQDYEIEQSVTGLNFLGAGPFGLVGGSQRIDESVEDRFVGPYVGFDFTAGITDRITVHLDTEVALLHNEARFSADQTVAAFSFGPNGAACDVFPQIHGDRCGFKYAASEVENSFGARPRVRVGIDVDLGPFTLGVSGGATYWSYAPQVVNGTPGNPGAGNFTAEKAHVSGDDMVAADVGLKITIPLR